MSVLPRNERFEEWFFDEGNADAEGGAHGDSWWQVMCLTGVDYFSTLGYQPGIAAPGRRRAVADRDPRPGAPDPVRCAAGLPAGGAARARTAKGSIAMLERLLTFWKGKLFVLVLLGFAATDFIITMTLSAADATAHMVENPHVPAFLQRPAAADHPGPARCCSARSSCAGSPRRSASRSSWSATYLALNVVVIGGGALARRPAHPHVVGDWTRALTTAARQPADDGRDRAAGLPASSRSGCPASRPASRSCRTSRATPATPRRAPAGRIRGTKRLLTTAAVHHERLPDHQQPRHHAADPGGRSSRPAATANGRALAYLAHEYLGNVFGTVYDVSTIAILWFAGASAMAGLLNLIPRYLPRYGMAPDWAARGPAARPRPHRASRS